MTEVAVTGVYGWNPVWVTGGSGGIPMGCGACAVFGLELEPIKLLRSWICGRGEVADETEEESYDLVDGLGERGKGLCDDAAIMERL